VVSCESIVALLHRIHGISDENNRQIHALLTDHQKELEKGMQQSEHAGGENRRSAPATAAAAEASSQIRTNYVCLSLRSMA
jgi:hypothetical protein